MATQKFTGVIPPVVVPDTEDHQLDVASFERSINRMIDAGVDGLFFLAPRARSSSPPTSAVARLSQRPSVSSTTAFPFWSASSTPRPSA